jgi:hypothetical protein
MNSYAHPRECKVEESLSSANCAQRAPLLDRSGLPGRRRIPLMHLDRLLRPVRIPASCG